MIDFLSLVLMWWLMMAVMMLPVTLPWFTALRRLGGNGSVGPLLRFGIGYFGVWLGFSIGAASIQTGLAANALLARGAATPAIGGVLLLFAGLYQLSPVKTACLKHCRSPMAYFLSKWDDGPIGTLKLGTQHGMFCLGCCWALMLLGFAMGVMNWWWMAALTGILVLENLSKHGRTLSRIVGLGLVLLSFSACQDNGPRACTLIFAYGITVTVTDALSARPLAEATGTLTEGDFVEEMMAVGTGTLVGAGERPGVYAIEVVAPDHASWSTVGVELGFDGCHVIGRAFDVALQPS